MVRPETADLRQRFLQRSSRREAPAIAIWRVWAEGPVDDCCHVGPGLGPQVTKCFPPSFFSSTRY